MSQVKLAQERSLETKKNIYEKALALFCSKGFKETSMSMIAKEAKVGKATLYYYAKTKEELAVSILKDAIAEILETIRSISAKDVNPEEKIRLIINNHINWIMEKKNLMPIFAHQIGNSQPHLNNLMKNGREEYREIIVNILQEGIDLDSFRDVNTDLTARILFSITVSTRMHAFVGKKYGAENGGACCDNAIGDVDELKKAIADIFLKGVKR